VSHQSSHSQWQNKLHAVRHHPTYLPTFGYAHDFYICDNCHTEAHSHSLFGHSANGTYRLPEGLRPDSEEAYAYLAGAQKFKVVEIEVYRVTFK